MSINSKRTTKPEETEKLQVLVGKTVECHGATMGHDNPLKPEQRIFGVIKEISMLQDPEEIVMQISDVKRGDLLCKITSVLGEIMPIECGDIDSRSWSPSQFRGEMYIDTVSFFQAIGNALNPKPPEPEPQKQLNVQDLIAAGKLTECKELMDRYVADGSMRKDGAIVHMDLRLAQFECMCRFVHYVEHLESLTKNLKKFFVADEIVFHVPGMMASEAAIIEVETGCRGSIQTLPGASKDHGMCGTYPVIKGLGMRWVFEGRRE